MRHLVVLGVRKYRWDGGMQWRYHFDFDAMGRVEQFNPIVKPIIDTLRRVLRVT